MADEDKAPETVEAPKAPETPAFDAKAVGQQVAESVRAGMAEFLQNQPQYPAPQPPAQPQQAEDALGQVLEPYLRSAGNKATLIAQMAADKADFYAVGDADELEDRLAFKDEIEKRAVALASQGRALPREDIFKHLKGERFGEFVEKAQKRKTRREDRARQEGGDHGDLGVPRERGAIPSYLSSDEAYGLQGKGKLEEFLGDKAF